MKNNVVLIVDDIQENREPLAELFYNDYIVLQASNREEAITVLNRHKRDTAVMLLNLVMQEKNGFDIIEFMYERQYIHEIPVVLISDKENENIQVEGLRRGACDIVCKPFNSNIVKQRVRNAIELYRYKRSLSRIVEQQAEKFTGITESVADVLIAVMRVEDETVRKTIQRIRAYTREVLNFIYEYSDEKYGLTLQKISLISTAAILQDVEGYKKYQAKIKENYSEWIREYIKKDSVRIKAFDSIENEEYIKTALEISKYKHERWDGSGYPEKLVGVEIPISAQVVGLVTTYDNLREGKITGYNYAHKEALNAIEKGEFGIFSPILIESCKIMGKELEVIYNKYHSNTLTS